MSDEVRTVENALHDLRNTLKAFDQVLDPYLSGEANADVRRTLEAQFKSARRVLLFLANSIVDVHGDANAESASMRASILWETQTASLAKYGIVPTEDGKLFTFEREDTNAD